jgi:8-hydroxy-5-deazaflavin:NADPH oxidoreductase
MRDMKKTVAIIGTKELDASIVKLLSVGNYRLLVFNHKKETGNRLLKQVRTDNPSAEVEFAGCAFDASWEADLIILNEFDSNEYDREETLTKIKPVTTQKPVINFLERTSNQQLKKLLPDSKIIKVSPLNPSNDIKNILQSL